MSRSGGSVTQRVNGTSFAGTTSQTTPGATLQNIAITTAGGDIEVIFSFLGYGSMTNVPCYVRIGLDGANFEAVFASSEPIANGYFAGGGYKLFQGVAAGAHTVNIQYWTDNGSNSFVAAGGHPAVIEYR